MNAQIVKKPEPSVLHNIAHDAQIHVRTKKTRAEKEAEIRVMRGRFNRIKGLEKLGR